MSEKNVKDQVNEDSRFSLLTDALDQASLKIVNKILRFVIYSTNP